MIMDQEHRDEVDPKAQEDRRAFLRRAGKASVGIPATALLLSVTQKNAKASGWGYGHGGDGKYDGKYGDFKEKIHEYKEHIESKYGEIDKDKIYEVIQKYKNGGLEP